MSFLFLSICGFNRFSTFLCALLFGFWRNGKKKNSLVGTNFQFNVVSKWKKDHMLYSFSKNTCLPQIDYSAEESHFLKYSGWLIWRGDRSSPLSSVGEGRAGGRIWDSLKQKGHILLCLLRLCAFWCPCLTTPAVETCGHGIVVVFF